MTNNLDLAYMNLRIKCQILMPIAIRTFNVRLDLEGPEREVKASMLESSEMRKRKNFRLESLAEND